MAVVFQLIKLIDRGRAGPMRDACTLLDARLAACADA
jgi:hypothetical protein